MPSDHTRALSFPAPGPDRLTTVERPSSSSAEKEKLGELAAQFESTLMLEMIKQMRKSLLDEGEGDGLGKETYSSTIDQELALHLAKAGGMGLTTSMVEAWERQQTAVAPGSLVTPSVRPAIPVSRSTAGTTASHPTVSDLRHISPDLQVGDADADSTLSLEIAGRVSSSYGWRADPMKRGSRFHHGIDLAARYGTTVPAAAAGSVVAAQEQGAYGLTVVVKHPNGFESRYAHLASLDVKVGDTVAQGQQVGRVGSTGRSTGPHLHFEVTQAGRRLDPEQFVRNLTSDTKGQ